MTALTLYGSSVASTTLSTADQLSTTTGGTETSKTTTAPNDSSQNWMELLSQGGSGTDSASQGSPSGKGYLYESTALEGQRIATGNWSAVVRMNDTAGFTAITFNIRFYKRSSGGTYTSIGSLTLASQSMSSTTTTYTFSASSLSQMDFATGDKLYVDFWMHPVTGHWTGDPIVNFVSNSASAGIANDFQITTPGYSPTPVTNSRTITPVTAALLVTSSRTIPSTAALLVTNSRTIPSTAALLTTNSRTIPSTAALLTTNSRTIPASASLIVRLLSGAGILWANGNPGTATFRNFRWTQYPDPSLSLAPVLPRSGATGVIWNALTPTNTTLTTAISTDGVNFTNVSSGASLPGIFSQPSPTIDIFATNTSANYTSTARTGGATGAWTFDTGNSRLVATSGTNAILLNTAISRADVDFFADLDRSDAGGLVWRFADASNFYYLLIGDTLASTGTKNAVTLYKVVANVQTQLGTAAISYTVGPTIVNFTRGTYHRFRVTMLGSAITVYCDGQSLLTATDASLSSAGQIGLYNNGGSVGSRYYQLWIIQVGDNIGGSPAGDIVTADFVYTKQTLTTTDPTATPQVEDLTTYALTPSINAGVTIPAINYNASYIGKNFDDLAKQSNYAWYFQNGSFVFGGTNAVAAPWILQSSPYGLVTTNDLEVNGDLQLDVGNDLYRNRQIIVGALNTLTASATLTADGNTRSFTLGYPLAAAPTITVNGISQTVGTKGSSGFQWYWAYNDPVIVQDAGQTVLPAGQLLSVPNYSGLYAVNVTVDRTAAQSTLAPLENGTGIVENVADYTGKNLSYSAAVTLANQLLSRYGITGRSLTFDTTRSGLALGQMLSIQLPEHGISNGQFLIVQIEMRLQKNVSDQQIWWYKVTASELPKKASLAKLIAAGLDFQAGGSSNFTSASG